MLNESESMEDFGTPKLDLVLLVLLAWIIIYFCIWKGVKSTGKVCYIKSNTILTNDTMFLFSVFDILNCV